jgi:hypothetical protein
VLWEVDVDTPGEIKGLPKGRVKADALNEKEKLLPTRTVGLATGAHCGPASRLGGEPRGKPERKASLG